MIHAYCAGCRVGEYGVRGGAGTGIRCQCSGCNPFLTALTDMAALATLRDVQNLNHII